MAWGKQMVEAWNAENPDEQVIAQEIPAGDSSEEVIGAAITAGNAPCLVFNTAPAAVPQFQKQGGLVALDGFEGDADVAFVLTTNRVELLERALVERPGRVDLAVEIPRPHQDARRRLFALYAERAPFSAEAVTAVADQSEGVTGSFAKELVRRALLQAATEGRPVNDADLLAASEELRHDRESLTRRLVGGDPLPGDDDAEQFDGEVE